MLSSPESEEPQRASTSSNPVFVHRKIEDEIEHFVENFKQKSSVLDRRLSSDSGDSSGWTSSVFSATDTPSTDSPDRDGELLPLPEEDIHGRNGIIAESRRIAQWALRQSRYASTGRDTCSCTYHPKSGPTGEAAADKMKQIQVPDVAELLQSRYVILTGGKAKNGAPMLTFPDRHGGHDVTDEDYSRVVTYLCGLLPAQEVESGVVVVIDRRHDGWGSARSILLKMSAFFPHHVQVVFLLQPKGFFQRAFADIRSKFVKEELEFKVIVCDNPEEMADCIEGSQLTKDLGGDLSFDTNEWTEHRSAVEKFAQNADGVSTNFKKAAHRFEEQLLQQQQQHHQQQQHQQQQQQKQQPEQQQQQQQQQQQAPQNDVSEVQEMEALMRCSMAERKELLDDYGSSRTHGHTLLGCIRGPDSALTPLGSLCHVLELERLLVKVDEAKGQFDLFWTGHERKMQQALHVRHFENDVKETRSHLQRLLDDLERRRGVWGSSLAQVEELLKEQDTLDRECQKELEQVERMRCRGDQLVMDDQYAVDSIRPKCVELQRMCEQYKDLLRRRHQMLARSHDLHDRLDRANRWCSAGADLLASRPLEQCKTTQGAAEALADFDTYLQTSRDLRLSNPRELRNVFDDVMTAETKGNVQQVLKQMDDVYAMCEKRRASLHKMGGPHGQPLSPPTHIPHRRFSSHHPHDEMDSSAEHRRRCSREESMRKVQGYQDKPTRLRPVDTGVGHNSASSGHDSSSSGISSKTSSIAASDASSSDLPMTSDSAQRGSLSSVSLSSLPEIDVLQAKRRHVMNELIETEQAYVTELQEILWGYLKEMDSRAMQHIIPEELIGQKHVLFGNLEQICKFHAETFLEELQDCRDYPAKVGRCFVNRREEFQMYSIYCQNKPKSEALRMRVGDLNPFFKECQHKLGHKLPLGAYLLKPVQRITKYQLLLKEMLRFTGDDKDLERQLQDALDTMLSVLQYLNASMHQVHIVGYQENLLDLGRLLMHGGFSVWTEHKRERIKDLRFKAMQRHIFLYERGLLLCKKKEESNDDPVYVFKNKLKLSQVGLTEKLRGDKRRFELWSRGREEVFIIQAANLQVKDVWVKEIKRVLMNQFDQIRSHHKMYVPMTQEEPSSTFSSTQLSSDSSDYSLDNWRGGGGGGGGNGGGGYSSAATTSSAAPLPPPPPSSSSSSSSSAVTTTIPSATTSTTIMTSTTSTPAYNIINNNHTSTLPMGLEMISPLTPPSNTSFTTHCLPHTQPHLHHRHPADRGRRMEEESWSSGELSNEETGQETARSYEPSYRQQFVSLSDYEAVDSTELGMGDGDVVEVLRVGGHGWWYARLVSTGAEGWVPSTFLDPVPVPQQSINSSSDSLSTPGKREMSLSRSSLGSPYYLSSPVSETTV